MPAETDAGILIAAEEWLPALAAMPVPAAADINHAEAVKPPAELTNSPAAGSLHAEADGGGAGADEFATCVADRLAADADDPSASTQAAGAGADVSALLRASTSRFKPGESRSSESAVSSPTKAAAEAAAAPLAAGRATEVRFARDSDVFRAAAADEALETGPSRLVVTDINAVLTAPLLWPSIWRFK